MGNKTNSKATKEIKEQAATMDSKAFNAIMDSVSGITKGNGSTKNSIYKAEIFDGLSDKEKRSRRRKLRRVRDAFIGDYLTKAKDPKALKELQKSWLEYAGKVYNDARYIFEKNTVEDNQEACQNFVKAMSQEYK